MEAARRIVTQIAHTPPHELRNLCLLHRSLLPFLAVASHLYRLSLIVREQFYYLGLFPKHRLPVPVISVGNLTWGGNGKTPMVEFIACSLSHTGISPLIITRHRSLLRDLEIAMINGVIPWGNNQLLPLGPLREPLTALRRADIVVIHHADMLSDRQLKVLESMVHEIKQCIPIFFSRMSPSHFFEAQDCDSRLPLRFVYNKVVLCVSAIGFANAFVLGIEKMGPLYVDRIDFSDHHFIQDKDIEIIRKRIRKLKVDFGVNPIVIMTEKDYDRDPVILKRMDDFEVLVLCSSLRIMPFRGQTEECFNILLKNLIEQFYCN